LLDIITLVARKSGGCQQTRRQELKQDSLTSIVSTSGGSIGASTVETATAVQLYFKTEYFTPEVFYSE
jgi:hypothetical protein